MHAQKPRNKQQQERLRQADAHKRQADRNRAYEFAFPHWHDSQAWAHTLPLSYQEYCAMSPEEFYWWCRADEKFGYGDVGRFRALCYALQTPEGCFRNYAVWEVSNQNGPNQKDFNHTYGWFRGAKRWATVLGGYDPPEYDGQVIGVGERVVGAQRLAVESVLQKQHARTRQQISRDFQTTNQGFLMRDFCAFMAGSPRYQFGFPIISRKDWTDCANRMLPAPI
jgi:hypothetical protein